MLATKLAKIIFCVKYGCSATITSGALIAAGAGFDMILESAGKEKIFIPTAGNALKNILPENKTAEQIYNDNLHKFRELKQGLQIEKYIRDRLEQLPSENLEQLGLSKEDIPEIKDAFNEVLKASSEERTNMISKIIAEIEKGRGN